MNTHTEGTLRRLLPSDVSSAFALSAAANWNQLPDDWERVMTLAPDGCFGLECEGRLAATSVVVGYGGQLAWIGMVLTAPEFRRRGFAERLIQESLRFADACGIANVKLDATEAGLQLYRKHGFIEECAVERWQRTAGILAAASVGPFRMPSFDLEIFGANRSHLLALLSKHDTASLPGRAFAMGRPGFHAAYFGPCVSDSANSARTLLRWFLAKHPAENVFWDLFPTNTQAVELAREFGFEPVRRLVRMSLTKAASHLQCDYTRQFAISGFEFG